MCSRGPSMVREFALNVYECILSTAHKRQPRCVVDAFAFLVRYHQRNRQIFCQEAIMWKYLRHPNILSLRGVTMTPKFQLVSDWMSGGHLPGYIRMNPDADRLGLVGVTGFLPIPHLHPSQVI